MNQRTEPVDEHVRLYRVLVTVSFGVFVICINSLYSNLDDYICYYFMGSLAAARVGGNPVAENVEAQAVALEATLRADSKPIGYVRLGAARTLYCPGVVPAIWLSEQLRCGLCPTPELLPFWIGCWCFLLWAAGVGLAVGLAVRGFHDAECWLPVGGALFVSVLHLYASPLIPVPRGLSILMCGLAVTRVLRGSEGGETHVLLWLAAFLHPAQQGLNLLCAVATLWVVWARPCHHDPRTWTGFRAVASAGTAVLLAWTVCWLSNNGRVPSPDSFLGAGAGLKHHLKELEMAVRFGFGPPGLALLFLTWYRHGRRGALAVGGLMALGFAAVAFFLASPWYPGVFAERLGGGWIVVLFAAAVDSWLGGPGSGRSSPGGFSGGLSRPVLATVFAAVCCLYFLWMAVYMRHPLMVWTAASLARTGSIQQLSPALSRSLARFGEATPGGPLRLGRPFTDMLGWIEALQPGGARPVADRPEAAEQASGRPGPARLPAER